MTPARPNRRQGISSTGIRRSLALAAATLGALPACAAGPETLMDTPVIYTDGGLDPFAHLPAESRTTTLSIFYATDRAPEGPANAPDYEFDVGQDMRLGVARVRFGDEDTSWNQLYEASRSARRRRPIHLLLDGVLELASLERDAQVGPAETLSPAQKRWVGEIDERLAATGNSELLVYVHGTKVSFYRVCARTAEFAHFAGRDLVCVALDWPSHTNILDYVSGWDVARAESSARSLCTLLELLAAHTSAERIHLIAYSAGAIVTTRALTALRREHADLSPTELRERFRIATVLFTSADVAADDFMARIGDIHDVAGDVALTMSDADNVLGMARVFMGGEERIGKEREHESEVRLEELARLESYDRLEVVDVSGGKRERGFDIGGHHYWYRHPWVSSDVIMRVRTGLAPAERGLVAEENARFWLLPADYPDRVRAAARARLGEGW